jgi:sensor histidine kinase YesM
VIFRFIEGDLLGIQRALVGWVAQLFVGFAVLISGAILTNIERPKLPRAIAFALAVIVGSALGRLAWIALMNGLFPDDPRNYFYFLRRSLLYWGLAAFAYYCAERSAQRSAALREADLDHRRLETRMLEARLQVMQAQVEPHFLFNTLAHIKRLYETDAKRGRRMLDAFCDYLDAALPQMRGDRSTLGRETAMARAYLETQQVRMGRRLRFEISVPEDLHDVAFPPMMLLSLVENAIKHGLNPLREGGRVEIRAQAHDSALHAAVADTGAGLAGIKSEGGTGIGLSNIRARLVALYGRAARLTIANNTPRGLIATIEIPWQLAPTADSHGTA